MDKSSEILKYFQNHNKLVSIKTLLSEQSRIHTKGNTLLANIGFIACEEKKNRIAETD